jgi:hypothetical protein
LDEIVHWKFQLLKFSSYIKNPIHFLDTVTKLLLLMPPKSNPRPQVERNEQSSGDFTGSQPSLPSLPHSHHFNLNLERVKVDQDALNYSQGGSTIYTGSVAGGRGGASVSEYEDDAASLRTTSTSLSSTDPSRFLRQLGGRVSNLLFSHLLLG